MKKSILLTRKPINCFKPSQCYTFIFAVQYDEQKIREYDSKNF